MANRLDSAVYQRYMALPTPGKVMATYIWIDGTGEVSWVATAPIIIPVPARRVEVVLFIVIVVKIFTTDHTAGYLCSTAGGLCSK